MKKIFALTKNSINMANFLVGKHKVAFTLAEVLITLGVIGVVAALTLPIIITKVQERILQQQFKTFYSQFMQGVRFLKAQDNSATNCYYWDKGKYAPCGVYCPDDDVDEYGVCNRTPYCHSTGEKIPADYNGPMNECGTFKMELFTKALKAAKICRENAYENGCLPKNFHGADVVKKEQNPDLNLNPNSASLFSDYQIKKNSPVFVLPNGMYFISYYVPANSELKRDEDAAVFTVDINGFQGPNKWGYDLFSFKMVGNEDVGVYKLESLVYATEKGGKTFYQMAKSIGLK